MCYLMLIFIAYFTLTLGDIAEKQFRPLRSIMLLFHGLSVYLSRSYIVRAQTAEDIDTITQIVLSTTAQGSSQIV